MYASSVCPESGGEAYARARWRLPRLAALLSRGFSVVLPISPAQVSPRIGYVYLAHRACPSVPCTTALRTSTLPIAMCYSCTTAVCRRQLQRGSTACSCSSSPPKRGKHPRIFNIVVKLAENGVVLHINPLTSFCDIEAQTLSVLASHNRGWGEHT